MRQAKAKHKARVRRNLANNVAQKTGRNIWENEQSVTKGVSVIDMSQLISFLKATAGRTVFKVTDDSAIQRSLSSTGTKATSFISHFIHSKLVIPTV